MMSSRWIGGTVSETSTISDIWVWLLLQISGETTVLHKHTGSLIFINRVQAVDRWENRPVAEIVRTHGVVYDSFDEANRREVNLRECPLEEHGREINVYDEEGYRVARRLGITDEDAIHNGILINLRDIGDLFRPEIRPGEDIDEDMTVSPVQFHVYPQAFLGSIGHFQAQGLIHGFLPIINKVNRSIGIPIQNRGANNAFNRELFGDGSDEEMEGEVGLPTQRAQSAVQGIACQGYNGLMHRARGHGGTQHEAQQGLLTSTLAGTYATTQKNMHTRTSFHMRCNAMLPHEAFALKLQTDELQRDIRFENVYIVDLWKMKNEHRNGR
jgi:hypothetical protein